MIAIIPLTKGYSAIVSLARYEELSRYKWCALVLKSGHVYAARRSSKLEGNKFVLMHRQILNAKDDELVDHRDCNTLNNHDSNLRLANKSQNGHNRKCIDRRSTTGFRGVTYSKRKKKYVAQIMFQNKGVFVGHFDSAEEAADARQQKAVELLGEFAQ